MGAEIRQGNVLGDRQVEQDAGRLAILGNQEDAVGDGVGGRFQGKRLAVQRNRSAKPAVNAEQDARQFRAA
jgi:hypothetical protein